jgi:predicted N-acetyltransferase YhbS
MDESTIKLDNLFILPEFIGKGLGKLLMNDFLTRIKRSEAKTILLDCEPNAENFYTKFGFTKVGHVETSTKDRYLP